ncbi:MAG TPA: hypothetical protein VFB69_07665 [Candidatus Dormibacteraeota bacterium]|nr:hypothetical protein [Candidatus Dormibacteraeota bacterium]
MAVCAFCGFQGKLTREDALPTWLMNYLWPAGTRKGMAKTWGSAQQLRQNWKLGYDYRLKTMTLCADCNTAWLGPFEKRAKAKLRAWISGLRGPVTQYELRLLAFWAIKTAMTVDLAHPGRRRHIPAGQYHELRTNVDRPPVGVHIWAAMRVIPYRGIGHMSRVFRFRYFDRGGAIARAHTQDGYQVILSIRHLELHVLGLGVGGLDPIELLPDYVAPLVAAESPFHRLWPLSEIPDLYQ